MKKNQIEEISSRERKKVELISHCNQDSYFVFRDNKILSAIEGPKENQLRYMTN